MSPEQRDALREANWRRASHICQNCGQSGVVERDGSEIGGMPGIKYRSCNGCGWSKAIVHRPPKEKL